MKKIIICLLFIVVITLVSFINIGFARQDSENYIIWGDVFSSGGLENSTSESYKTQDTIGEAIIWSATSTSETYGTKAGFRELYPDQFLTMTMGASSIDFPVANINVAHTTSHTLTIDTNAIKGFTITLTGETLTKGTDKIDAIGSAAQVYNTNVEQFGINLVANTSPIIGADPTGTAPLASVDAPFDTANQFAFDDVAANTIASATTDTGETVYTVSYLLNTISTTPPGDYSTTLTYAATANF
jgi:hypothetical protein